MDESLYSKFLKKNGLYAVSQDQVSSFIRDLESIKQLFNSDLPSDEIIELAEIKLDKLLAI